MKEKTDFSFKEFTSKDFSSTYPFAAIKGQEKAKKAVLIAMVNPRCGGLLLSGNTGTGKSVLLRAAAELLPEKEFINLPLNVTEDMLFGSLDVEYAVQKGERRFLPGLLGRADGSVLYIDDANLLRQELLIAVTGVNECGFNRVERDGISYEHSARFSLICAMNPLESVPEKHILERFGMFTELEDIKDTNLRQEIMRGRLDFAADPLSFRKKYSGDTKILREKLKKAVELMPQVEFSEAMMYLAAQMSVKAGCRGHRADIFLLECAAAVAALKGRTYIMPQDMEEAADFVLPHRMRKGESASNDGDAGNDAGNDNEDGSENSDSSRDEGNSSNDGEEGNNSGEVETTPEDDDGNESDMDGDSQNDDENAEVDADNSESNETADAAETAAGSASGYDGELQNADGGGAYDAENVEDENSETAENADAAENAQNSNDDAVAGIMQNIHLPELVLAGGRDTKTRRGSGKRSLTRTDMKQGRYVRAELPKNKLTDLAFDATIRAAAPWQKFRDKKGCAISIAKEDFRQKVREKRVGSTFLFVVDASGSMGAKERMEAVKGVIMTLLKNAYEKRDRVGMIAFRRKQAELLLPVTRSVDLAQKCLQHLPTGGKTPLAEALSLTLTTIEQLRRQEKDRELVLVLVTDGRANAVVTPGEDPLKNALKMAEYLGEEKISSLVIDTENTFLKLGIAKDIAKNMGAEYHHLENLIKGKDRFLHLVRNMGR